MDIIEALKSDSISLHITYGNRWLFWKNDICQWVVAEHEYHARRPTIVIETANEERAIEALIGDDENEL